MKKSTRKIVILMAAGCLAVVGFGGAAAGQTKNLAKTAATPKNQKSSAKTPPKPVAKSIEKSQAKPAATNTLSKQAVKSSDKSKNFVKTKTTPEKSASAANKAPANSKEKTLKEKASKEKSVKEKAAGQKPAAKIVSNKKPELKTAAKSNSTPKTATKPTAKISDSRQIIVSTTSARLRSAPDAGADTISTVNIGKILTVAEEKPAWAKVRISDEKSGWISKSIVADFNESKRADIYRVLVDKYFKNNKLDFTDASQIFDFLKNAAPQVKNNDDKADLSFKLLTALKAALGAIPFGKGMQNPYKDFLDANAKEVVYSEPSAEWLVRSDLIWETHGQYKDLPVGEEIAWMGAQNSLPGECEGYVNCYLYLARVTSGEYLNFYPGGKYSKKSLADIDAILEPITADLKNKAIYTAATDISDRAEFNRLLTELRTIISKVPHVEKAQTIQQINQIGDGFR